MYGPKKPIAIINNSVVGVGDTVEGARVTKISEKTVELTSDGKNITLKLED